EDGLKEREVALGHFFAKTQRRRRRIPHPVDRKPWAVFQLLSVFVRAQRGENSDLNSGCGQGAGELRHVLAQAADDVGGILGRQDEDVHQRPPPGGGGADSIPRLNALYASQLKDWRHPPLVLALRLKP